MAGIFTHSPLSFIHYFPWFVHLLPAIAIIHANTHSLQVPMRPKHLESKSTMIRKIPVSIRQTSPICWAACSTTLESPVNVHRFFEMGLNMNIGIIQDDRAWFFMKEKNSSMSGLPLKTS